MSQGTTRAVQARPCEPNVVEKMLSSPTMQQQLLAALPKHLAPQQIVRQAITLLRNTPALCDCTQFSVLSGIFKAAELGLALSGPLGQAYLVPRWNGTRKCKEATFQVGYRGLFQLAYRSKLVKKFEMRTRYANDHFTIQYGTAACIFHVPNLDDPGEAIGYYTVATLEDGKYDFEYMTKAQVEHHRLKYNPPKGEDYSPWAKSFDEMAQKTTARRLGKRLPMATELAEACSEDERGELGLAPVTHLVHQGELPELPSKMDALEEEIAAPSAATERPGKEEGSGETE